MAESSLGTRIKRARERRRWTQQELADRLGVDRKTVDNWENGRTTPRSSLGALEEVLGNLTDGDDEATPYPDPADPVEVALWGLTRFSERDRRVFIDAVRKASPRRELAG